MQYVNKREMVVVEIHFSTIPKNCGLCPYVYRGVPGDENGKGDVDVGPA
jgi:hypothetical protein